MFVKRKENESIGSLLYRFSKKVQQSGVLREARRRRFHGRPQNRTKRKLAAMYRAEKRIEVMRDRKLGLPSKKDKRFSRPFAR
ncbi:MAG: 30S ribosomal protein S21 [Candidatus Zambryskibacteria bacterium RIFCSPLOWO2_01_FULL_45_43]|uniref:Small ribosomal subunit protein bS21 n=2 Tax=Parcubacteria group TaxID=1794811 RepID=A0A1G1ZUC0_9BACT|nr:MAG: 30S ribosomal protein S21 [Candidatus Harrisonbacteria bacterium RIFCSPLOWO2_02_FULL_45_10c]OHB06078.1 MAG: 30S ribosomal protein S21 [Candidatus Zambryskibacteria bacterium RIFCSPLOWO2_01_FULL_45_43]